jgi:hypothetical protein
MTVIKRPNSFAAYNRGDVSERTSLLRRSSTVVDRVTSPVIDALPTTDLNQHLDQEKFIFPLTSRSSSIASTPQNGDEKSPENKKFVRSSSLTTAPTARTNFAHLTNFAQKISTLSNAGELEDALHENTKLLREMRSTSTWR